MGKAVSVGRWGPALPEEPGRKRPAGVPRGVERQVGPQSATRCNCRGLSLEGGIGHYLLPGVQRGVLPRDRGEAEGRSSVLGTDVRLWREGQLVIMRVASGSSGHHPHQEVEPAEKTEHLSVALNGTSVRG
jgi:hypothetical protein